MQKLSIPGKSVSNFLRDEQFEKKNVIIVCLFFRSRSVRDNGPEPQRRLRNPSRDEEQGRPERLHAADRGADPAAPGGPGDGRGPGRRPDPCVDDTRDDRPLLDELDLKESRTDAHRHGYAVPDKKGRIGEK